MANNGNSLAKKAKKLTKEIEDKGGELRSLFAKAYLIIPELAASTPEGTALLNLIVAREKCRPSVEGVSKLTGEMNKLIDASE